MFFEKLLMMISFPFLVVFLVTALIFLFIFTWLLIPFMTFERVQDSYKVTRIFGRPIV
jgi:hypothetical protein